jgi:hypothetical protein
VCRVDDPTLALAIVSINARRAAVLFTLPLTPSLVNSLLIARGIGILFGIPCLVNGFPSRIYLAARKDPADSCNSSGDCCGSRSPKRFFVADQYGSTAILEKINRAFSQIKRLVHFICKRFSLRTADYERA